MIFSNNLDIVVVNWNSGHHLNDCINSIQKNGKAFVAKTIIVDNGSTDGSENILKNIPNVELIRTGKNLGFGKACNLGAQKSKSKYLLFLNPDAALFSDTLSKALSFMQDPINAKVGICGVQLIDESGCVSRSCARLPTTFGLMAHAIGIDRLLPHLGHPMLEWPHDRTRDVDHVIGAFFMMRRELFDSLNGFDEQFFVYLEDLDFSCRSRQAGWKSAYLADVQAFHLGGGASNQVKAKRLFYSLRSRLLYVVKHFSWAGAFLVILSTLFIEPISRSVLALFRRSWPSMKETWQGYAMLWRWLPKWFLRGVTR